MHFIIQRLCFCFYSLLSYSHCETTAHEEISTIECSLNSDLIAVHNWLKTNKLSCNTSKTSYMTIGSRQNLANAKFMNLELDDRPIEHKPSTKLLGVHIDEMLTWDNQIKHISSKVSNGLRMLYLARKLTDNQETLKTIYQLYDQLLFAKAKIFYSFWKNQSHHSSIHNTIYPLKTAHIKVFKLGNQVAISPLRICQSHPLTFSRSPPVRAIAIKRIT